MSNRPSFRDVPLKVLICDADDQTAELLWRSIEKISNTTVRGVATTLLKAQQQLRTGEVNAIFIDPETLGIEGAAEFIFSVRTAMPEIVFVLYVDMRRVEANRAHFYSGERHRFNHYYRLDKAVPLAEFTDELDAVAHQCRYDLSWRLSKESLAAIAEDLDVGTHAKHDGSIEASVLQTIQHAVAHVVKTQRAAIVKRSVFVSHRFEEIEWIDGLTQLLKSAGFSVIDGKSSNTYIGRGVIERIRSAEFFLCLLTRHRQKADGMFTTSPWLLEEKGAALALGKPLVLMIEDGVDDYGGLQGDWQRIHFTQKGFTNAALAAVDQLSSYAGFPTEATGEA